MEKLDENKCKALKEEVHQIMLRVQYHPDLQFESKHDLLKTVETKARKIIEMVEGYREK